MSTTVSSEIAGQALVSTSLVYTKDELNRELRQTEILSNVTQCVYDPQADELEAIIHPLSMILSQDCDLLQDYDTRVATKSGNLDNVLLFVVDEADVIRPKLPGGDIFRRIKRNGEERYQYLEALGPSQDMGGAGIASMIIDFKRFYTMRPSELYRQIDAGSAFRRSRLLNPYREHCQARAAAYASRVSLPAPHQ